MSTRKLNAAVEEAIGQDLIDKICESFVAEKATASRVDRLRMRVMAQIDDDSREPGLFETIRKNEGNWIEVMPDVQKKVLQVDHESGIETYLMRIGAGARIGNHSHDSNELCYVIEGDIAFGDIELQAGDYHFASKGSGHGDVRTVNGALLFLQTGIGGEHLEPR